MGNLTRELRVDRGEFVVFIRKEDTRLRQKSKVKWAKEGKENSSLLPQKNSNGWELCNFW